MKWRWAYVPGAIFVAAEGAVNVMFAESLGTGPVSVWIWRAIAVGVTITTALGARWVYNNWKAGDYSRAAAAFVVWGCALSYDVLAEYGFSSRQHITTGSMATDSARKRREAEAAVASKRRDLEPYAHAGDPAVADSQVTALQSQIDEIDAKPGIKWKGQPCGRVRGDWLKEICDKRATIDTQLTEAQTAAAESRAKQRLQLELATAQQTLNNLPSVDPGDTRAQLVPEWVLVWLPVVLLTAGSAFGWFLVPPLPELPPAEPTGSSTTPAPRRRKKAVTGSARAELAQRLADLSSEDLPANVYFDGNSYEATQKQLAELLGYGKNVARLNRELHEAAAGGKIDLEVSPRGTRVRLKAASQ